MLFATGFVSHGETAVEAWVRRYGFEGNGSADSASKVVTDAAGNVIVAGYTDDHFNSTPDMLLIKYSGAGVPVWTNRYNGPGNSDDSVTDIAVDTSGNVIVTGRSLGQVTGVDFATIKYSGAGVPVWTNRYNGPGNGNDYVSAIAVDASGNVFVTGGSPPIGTGNNDYAAVAYSAAGVPLWTNRYNGPGNGNDFAIAIAVDAGGNVFATGYSASTNTFPPDYAFATIKYSGSGIPLWTNRYNAPGNGDDLAVGIAVDSGGNVIVAGSSPDGNSTDYATIKYSNTGAPLWTNRFKGSADSTDLVRAMAVDASGNAFVTGLSRASGTNANLATVAYSGAGLPLWTNRFNGPDNNDNVAAAIAVDASGNVFVTGSLTDEWGFVRDYATIAYSGAGVPVWTNYGNAYARDMTVDSGGNVFVTGSSTDEWGSVADWVTTAYSGAGAPLWTNGYNGPDRTRLDHGTAVAVDSGGNVFVTGPSYEASGTSYDFATIKYSSAGVPLWINRYNGPGNYDDRATVLAVDSNGNVFVTGYSFQGSSSASDFATIAYSGAGEALWTNRFGGTGNEADVPNAIAVDNSGNVFVTGSSAGSGTSYDFATIKYSGAGVPLWTNLYNGPNNGADGASAIAVDSSGNVFVTGGSIGADGFAHYATIAYSGAGAPLWTNRFHRPSSGDDAATVIAVDSSGNVLVTGYSYGDISAEDYATIKYSSAGVALWTNRYNGPANGSDFASAMAVDSSGNLIVTGRSYGGTNTSYDYATIKYSNAGVALWTNRYNGGANGIDFASAMAVDSSGNVIVTGRSYGGTNTDYDYATIKYSGAGVPLWTNRYDGPGHGTDQPQGKASLAIGPDGAVYVTGASDGVEGIYETGFDYATIKYVTVPVLAIQPPIGGSSDVHLMLSGTPNSVWTVERAAALPGPWTSLGPVTVPTNGSAPFQDPTPLKSAAFYRARQ
jgi:uncharacterized delta-60 repeat protein